MAEVSNRKIHMLISSFFIMLCFCSSPVQAQYGGGTGEPNDPYLIYTAEQMNEIGLHEEDWNKQFKLMANVDLCDYMGTDFNIIGGLDKPFTGVFDGNRHTISNFSFTSTKRDCIGLFGYMNDPNAEIRDLGLLDPNVDAGTGSCVSSLVGCLANGIIPNCYVKGGSISGNKYVGGLIGGNLPVYPASPEDFADEWLNDDPDTRGMTRLIIGLQNGVMNVHGYGKCHPTDCDWGTITAEYSGNPFVAVYEFGFVTTTLTICLICPNNLHVHKSGVFHDGTNRDFETDYFMHRAAESPVHPDGLAAKKYGNSTIAMCYSMARVSGVNQVGGLMGNNYGTVSDSYSTGNIFGNNDVGGLVGYNYGQITGCSTVGNVRGNKFVGGLAGNDAMGQISNSYAISSVNGNDRVGGLTGAIDFGIVTNCYAAGSVSANENVGGLIGHIWNGRVFASFWDTQTSGQVRSYGGIGTTTAEMQTASTFLEAGWDFVDETANGTEDIWWILEGQSYPRLWWQYGRAFSPYPQDGAVDVPHPLFLIWSPGGSGLRHDIYFGEDKEAVTNATIESPEIYRGRQEPAITYYNPGNLELVKTYYWRIDEVNQANPNSPWKGNAWSLTTANFIVVDDFESYDAYNQIWWTWRDGLGYATESWPEYGTGSVVGDESTTSYTEETIVHGGKQSMPYRYDNDKPGFAKYSHAERFMSYPRDWTEEGVEELSLWFYGEPTNDSEPMYVTISNRFGAPVAVYHNDPNAAGVEVWTEWIISLQKFADQGINLTDVDRIAIGLGIQGNRTIPGGRGKMYFDDIRLYRPRSTASHDLEVNVQ